MANINLKPWLAVGTVAAAVGAILWGSRRKAGAGPVWDLPPVEAPPEPLPEEPVPPIEEPPPVYTPQPTVSLVAFDARVMAYRPNPSSPALPPGAVRIFLVGGNQAIELGVEGIVVMGNYDDAQDSALFTVDMDVMVGGRLLRKAVHTTRGGAYPYSGPGAGTTMVGPLRISPLSSLDLAFDSYVTLDDPLVGSVGMQVTVKSGAGTILGTRTMTIPDVFVNGTPGAAGA